MPHGAYVQPQENPFRDSAPMGVGTRSAVSDCRRGSSPHRLITVIVRRCALRRLRELGLDLAIAVGTTQTTIRSPRGSCLSARTSTSMSGQRPVPAARNLQRAKRNADLHLPFWLRLIGRKHALGLRRYWQRSSQVLRTTVTVLPNAVGGLSGPMATAKSSLPSLLKSPTQTDFGLPPVK